MARSDVFLPFAAGAAGGVTVAAEAIARLAGHAARTTYGVVGMQSSPMRRLASLFGNALAEGVEVEATAGAVAIGLHVVMERGVNIAQVTANLQEAVRYLVETVSGVPVRSIDVRVEDLKD